MIDELDIILKDRIIAEKLLVNKINEIIKVINEILLEKEMDEERRRYDREYPSE